MFGIFNGGTQTYQTLDRSTSTINFFDLNYACMHVDNIHTHTYIDRQTQRQTHTWTYMHACVHAYVRTYIHVYTYINACMHAHTHTYTNAFK